MQVNQKVQGSYCGHSFVGVIEEKRPVYVPTDGAFLHYVRLDEPMTIFGEARDVLCLYTKHDGSPSSYTKFSDWMRAA